MKKSEIKNIIKECLIEMIAEGNLSLRVNTVQEQVYTTPPQNTNRVNENKKYVGQKVGNVSQNGKKTYTQEQIRIMKQRKAQQEAQLMTESRRKSYGAGSMFDDLINNASNGSEDDILGPGMGGGSTDAGSTAGIVNNAHQQDFSKFSDIFGDTRL
jgi:hypothetical protein